MDQTHALAAAVQQHEASIAAAKRRYTQCIAELVAAPGDAALLGEIAQLSGQLASASAGLDALNQALESAREADERRAVEDRKAAGRKRAQQVIAKVKARRASYDALQASADAFLQTLHDHVQNGATHRADAHLSATEVYGAGRADEHVDPPADAAAGTSSIDSLAVASILRKAIEVYGTARLSRWIGVDSFAVSTTLDAAWAADLKVVQRLAA